MRHQVITAAMGLVWAGAVAAAPPVGILAGTPAGGVAVPDGLGHWPIAERLGYAAYESALNAVPSADRLMEWHELLCSEPHVAGTEADWRTAARIAAAFAAMGLEVEKHEIWVYLCKPTAAVLEIVEPGGETVQLGIKEEPIEGDRFTENPDLWPGWNAFSGSGDVTSGVVYAHYGTKADFEQLKALGVDVTGKIVLARYGGNFRGYKAKFAEAAGAAGLVIFTDPADTGYMKGLMYPEGGYQTESCIQRGSILTLPYSGDPLTPFIEATKDAVRLDPDDVAMPKIPVQPIGWGAAREIMARMTGPAVPQGWQGGLPLPYRLTGGEGVKVRLMVQQERGLTKTYNVTGTLRGEREPERMVVIGSHHDAWGFGAADPIAGTIAVMESARSFSELAKAGKRPARSIVFAAWGAEEFGIIGSVEWVEANRDRLVSNAVAYINLDMASMGPEFGASASPSLRPLIAAAARSVPQARAGDGSAVIEQWLVRMPDEANPGIPRFGDIGGGSDHVGFLCHAGVPSAGMGGGGSPGTAWHTTRDNLAWYWKVVGPDYEPAMMITRMTNTVAARLACAPLIPLDAERPLADMGRTLAAMAGRIGEVRGDGSEDDAASGSEAPLAGLREEAESVRGLAAAVGSRLLAAVEAGSLSAEQLGTLNGLLLRLDRAWLRAEGAPGRPWYRNLQAATDENSGYAAWVLPALARAIERREAQEIAEAAVMYHEVLGRIRGILVEMDSVAEEEGGGQR